MKLRILYLDPFSGISGDMFIGALLDLGLDLAKLHHELSKLKLSGYSLSSRPVMRGAMAGTKFDVELEQKPGPSAQTAGSEAGHGYEHSHGEHGHSHGEHGHSHGVEPAGISTPGTAVYRGFEEIKALIEASELSERVKADSVKAFETLAVAEGRIHNIPPERVTFHEAGAVDSIVDMVGVCIGLELLEIDEIWCAPVALGSGGYVKCEHGIMPVPAPATLELMKGLPIRPTQMQKELTTPTGAALLRALAQFGPLPAMNILAIGYGAGTRNDPAMPNILRVLLGEIDGPPSSTGMCDTIIEVRTNIDHASGELLGYLSEKLLASGVLDVFFTPITMKKSRPATMLSVLAEPHQLDMVAEIIFRESGTFGLRYQQHSRLKLLRRTVTLETPYGQVRAKVGKWQDLPEVVHFEYEDCRARAQEKGVSLEAVMEAAREAFRRQ